MVKKTRGKMMFLILLATSALLGTSLVDATADGGSLLKDIYERQGLGKGSFVIEFGVISYEGKEKNDAKVKVYLYDNDKQIVTFMAPERFKDDAYLVMGFNTWMYKKNLRRPIRISAQQKLFGDAGIAEAAGIDYVHDYEIKEFKEGFDQYELSLKAFDKRTAYQKALIYIDKTTKNLKRIELQALSGQSLKELTYENHQVINGHELGTIYVKNLLQQKDRKTIIQFLKVTERLLPIEAFDPSRMSKLDLMFQS